MVMFLLQLKIISDTRLPLLNINLEVNETISLSIGLSLIIVEFGTNLESYFYKFRVEI